MSKSIKIPDTLTRIEVTVNGKTYVYKGGATVTVPDEVAALLERNAANAPSGVRTSAEDEKLADITGAVAGVKADVEGLRADVEGLETRVAALEDDGTEET